MSKISNHLKLCLITFPLGEVKGGHVLVENFLQILEPLSKEIYLITGNYPQSAVFSSKIHLTNVKHGSKKRSMLTKILKYVKTQMVLSINLVAVAKHTDCIIFYLGGAVLLLPMLVAKLLRKKTILIAAGSSSESAKRIYNERFFGMEGFIFSHIIAVLEKINYNLSDKIVVYSEGLIHQLRLDRYKDKILPRGARFIDTELFKKKSIHERDNLIGYIGRLSEEKGVRNLIQAIPRVLEATKDVNFFIIGDGKLRNIAEEFVSKKNMKDKVSFIDWIQHDELPDYLNKLQLVVLSSYTEGLPNLMLEAMACGTPVLATPVGAIPDVIKDGKTGFIMENNSAESIAENVMRALKYPDLEGIVKNARKLVEEEYTYEAAVGRYRRILEGM